MDSILNLLLVDDQPENLVALEALLNFGDYRVTSVTSGQDAMIALLKKEFALIILDVEMPMMNGIELARVIKDRPKTRDVPIIFLTARHDAERDILSGYGAGAVDYVTKPVNSAILQSKVGIFADLYRKNRDLKAANAALLQEIAERKITELALQEANRVTNERTAELHELVRELEAFSYSIAHDMRAPLRGMQGFSQILRDEYASRLDARGLEYLRRIESAARRLDRLIQDVLSYSKVLRAPAPMQALDLDQLTRDIIATYPNWQLPQAEVYIDGKLPPVFGNEAFLTQCISNLVGNAVKFQAPGQLARVKIWAEPKGGLARLWVEDNGIGIDAKYHNRIFGLFEKIHAPAEYEGTGVGLTIVRKAVERMSGEYGFESEVGKGSRFWVQLKTGEAS